MRPPPTRMLRPVNPAALTARHSSSDRWLRRQQTDPYVKKAHELGYRARSAFKLIEMDDRFGLLRPGMAVVECGAAPGAWTQVAADRVNAGGEYQRRKKAGVLVGCDLLPVHAVAGAHLLPRSDFTHADTQARIRQLLSGRPADLVLSDMAPNASGFGSSDSDAQSALAAAALRFAVLNSAPGSGTFLCKLWQGARTKNFMSTAERFYGRVELVKPKSSRPESPEVFVLARQFRGAKMT